MKTKFLLLLSVLALMSQRAFSAAPSVDPKIWEIQEVPQDLEVLWIDEKGEFANFNFKQKSKWVWKTVDGIERPMIQVSFKIPRSYQVDVVSVDVGKIEKDEKEGELLFDLVGTDGSASVEVKKDQGNPVQISLLIMSKESPPAHFIHESCKDLGLQGQTLFEQTSKVQDFIYCKKTDPSQVEIFLVSNFPDEVKIGKDPLSKKNAKLLNTTGVPLQLNAEKKVEFGYYKDQNPVALYQIGPEDASKTKKKYGISPSLGFAYIDYLETTALTRVNEVGIHLKVDGSIRIIPDRLDAEGSLYSILPFTLWGVGSQTRAYFLGGRLWAKYRLPLKWTWAKFYGTGGAFFWKMLVPDQSYGIQTTTGPFIGVSSEFLGIKKNPMTVYFRFGMLTGSPALSFVNREFDLGGSWQFTRLGKCNFHLTLDISQTAYSESSNTMSFAALILGAKMDI